MSPRGGRFRRTGVTTRVNRPKERDEVLTARYATGGPHAFEELFRRYEPEQTLMENERTPPEVREGVRSGILSSIRRDVELRGGRTARLLVAAGLIGVFGGIGATLLISVHPVDRHSPWHMVVFSAIWTGLLVVALAFAFLRVRTPALSLGRSAAVGVLGLGLAVICAAACPDPHFLHWWSATGIGASLTKAGGLHLSALCFGLVTTLFVGLVSAGAVLSGARRPVEPMLSAAALFVLLVPGVVLQSAGASFGVPAAWLVGAAAGAYLGVVGGARAQNLFSGV